MAKKLDEWDFKRMGRGQPGWYDQFLDGDIWQLDVSDTPGPGNAASIESVRGSILGYGRRLNKQREENGEEPLAIRTQVVKSYDDDGDEVEEEAILIIQALPYSQTQYDDEDHE